MNFELKDTQFEKLLRLAYLGMWVAEAHDEGQESYFKDIEQLLFEKAAESNLKEYVKHDKGSDKFFPSSAFDKDEIVSKAIDDYEEHCFWDELIDRLSKADIIAKYGMDNIQKMSFMERLDKEKEYMVIYEKEFAENGLKNLKVDVERP
ncbi:MAG: hypothetical protein ABUK01_19315 [Leptospirales bacterium]